MKVGKYGILSASQMKLQRAGVSLWPVQTEACDTQFELLSTPFSARDAWTWQARLCCLNSLPVPELVGNGESQG